MAKGKKEIFPYWKNICLPDIQTQLSARWREGVGDEKSSVLFYETKENNKWANRQRTYIRKCHPWCSGEKRRWVHVDLYLYLRVLEVSTSSALSEKADESLLQNRISTAHYSFFAQHAKEYYRGWRFQKKRTRHHQNLECIADYYVARIKSRLILAEYLNAKILEWILLRQYSHVMEQFDCNRHTCFRKNREIVS